MPRLITLVLGFITAILCGSILAANSNLGAPPARVGLDVDTPPAAQSLSKMPLSFTKNMGQWDDRVLFRANSGGATMWFTKEGVTYQFTRRISDNNTPPVGPLSRGDSTSSLAGASPSADIPLLRGVRGVSDRDSIEQLILTAKFIGANADPEVFAEGQMEYKCNYFIGNDPAKWHTDVLNYTAITLKDIYPGIDLKYSGGDGNGQAAYEFIAAPGADIAQIKVEYEGAEATALDSDGRLILKTKWGDLTAAIKSPADSPRPLGEGSGVRVALSGSATCARWTSSSTTSRPDLARGGDVRQALAGNSGTLTLSYSTYLGGGDYDVANDIAVDDKGDVYISGLTWSSNFPTWNPYQTPRVNGDAFVTKLSESGGSLAYSTYLGGGGWESAHGIAIDSSGRVYVTGWTESADFPTSNPYQNVFRGYYDAFVAKLSNSGRTLIYSTYLGGVDDDGGNDIAVDRSGNAYVTGWTGSSDFPTCNPYQMDQGSTDVFVSKLSATGNRLIYSTYLGGDFGAGGQEWGNGIAVDGNGNAYVTGYTASSDFPTQNPFQTWQGGPDCFVTKLAGSGSSLIYSTYLGGASYEQGFGIAIDGSGNAYVTGATSSSNFPTQNPLQTYFQGGTGRELFDAFITKLSSSGNSLIYSTYLGGGDDEWGQAITVDGSGYAYVTGFTWSPNFPTQNPYQAYQGGGDAFVTKLSSSGSSLICGTWLGGGAGDEGRGIAVDDSGNAFVTGYTSSPDFPTMNPYQTTFQGGDCDVFLTKLTWTPEYSCGDVNTDEQVNLVDVVFLINYIFVGGPAPQPLSLADVDCSGRINIADAVRLINYIFSGGPAPCAECE
jgi:hypothetical protein